MRLVIIESPFRGDATNPAEAARLVERNERYLDRCIADCLRRGESPIASHRMLVRVCRDDVPEERRRGIDAGFAWRRVAAATVVYVDHGVSSGMREGIAHAQREAEERKHRAFCGEHAIEVREIGAEPDAA
jgi:hypothetical protein